MIISPAALLSVAILIAGCSKRGETASTTTDAAAKSSRAANTDTGSAAITTPTPTTADTGLTPAVAQTSMTAADANPDQAPPTAYKPCFACNPSAFCFEVQCPMFFVLDPPSAGSVYGWYWGKRATLVTDAMPKDPELVESLCRGDGRKGLVAKGTTPAKVGRPASCFVTGKADGRIWYERWWGGAGIQLDYDESLKEYFDPIIVRMVTSFRAKQDGKDRDAEP